MARALILVILALIAFPMCHPKKVESTMAPLIIEIDNIELWLK